MSCLLDTNIIKNVLKGDAKLKSQLEQAIFEGRDIFISIITYYELKRGYVYSESTQTQIGPFEKFIEYCKLLSFNQQTADIASGIWANLKNKQKLPGELDILIAATAKEKGLPVVSLDKHFSHMEDIEHEEWDMP